MVVVLSYTLLDLQTSVQDDLQDTSFSSSRITRYLNYGQLVIFNTHMFRFCEKAVTGALTIGAYTYLQQTDQQSTIGGVLIDPVTTTSYVTLDEKNYMAHRDFFTQYPNPSGATSGRPSVWTEFGGQVYFNCPVDKAYIFRQRYYRVPTSMTLAASVPDVPESFRELLELYADFRGEKYRGNHDVAATYKQEFDDGLESMSMRYSGVTSIGPVRMRQGRMRVNDQI